jgi:hypothetical protein
VFAYKNTLYQFFPGHQANMPFILAALARILFFAVLGTVKLSAATPLALTNRKAGRLETNTSMPHMIGATSSGPGEPRVWIPVRRFLACPFIFTDNNPDHAGVSCTTCDSGLLAHFAAVGRLAP